VKEKKFRGTEPRTDWGIQRASRKEKKIKQGKIRPGKNPTPKNLPRKKGLLESSPPKEGGGGPGDISFMGRWSRPVLAQCIGKRKTQN